MLLGTSHILRCVSVAVALAAQSCRASVNPAGYDTSRVGPANAECQRQTYQLNVTSNNIVFNDVDPNANAVRLSASIQAGYRRANAVLDLLDRVDHYCGCCYGQHH